MFISSLGVLYDIVEPRTKFFDGLKCGGFDCTKITLVMKIKEKIW
jgi:hypothetical protein